MSANTNPVLSIKDLKTHFLTDLGVAPAVDGISLDIFPGESLGLVGESGCGKSVTGLSVMRLVSSPGKIIGGEVWLRRMPRLQHDYLGEPDSPPPLTPPAGGGEAGFVGDRNLLTLTEEQMRSVRGGGIGMIFQEPMTSLDPLYRIGDPIIEALQAHKKLPKPEALREAIRLLGRVGITDPEHRVRSYPHELSGGMRQRVMIAVALSCSPAVLIADEPTTALDVTVQAQILALIRELQQDTGTAVMLITHNLGLVAENCDTVAVMYSGKIVEKAPVRTIFKNPTHPYTQGLLRAAPRLDNPRKQMLPTIQGIVPNPLKLPTGCRFRTRCEWAIERCAEAEPPLSDLGNGHASACWVQPAYGSAPARSSKAGIT